MPIRQLTTRKAPADMRLVVPRHVLLTSVALGLATAVLGGGYAIGHIYRQPALERRSAVAAIEHPLGWAMLAIGLWVTVAVLTGHTRASAHAVAAVAHAVYLGAIGLTFVLAYPLQPIQGVALAVFGFVAHGGACLEYWHRGYR